MHLATVPLGRLVELRAPLRTVESESKPLFDKWLCTTPGIECVVPPHKIIAFPRIDGVGDTIALSEFLVREHGVDVVPGEFFARPGHVRVGCGVPAEKLRDGLARLERGIKSFRAART